jgi:hypothetical protein
VKRIYEKIMIVVLFILYYAVPYTCLPPETVDTEAIIIYTLDSAFLTFVTYLLYAKIRNHFIKNKYKRLLDSNQLDECLAYSEKWIERYPNSKWIKISKLVALAFSGKAEEYKAYLAEVRKQRLNKKELKLTDNLSHVLDYFKGENVDIDRNAEFLLKNPLDRINYLIAFEGELAESEAVRSANLIYIFPYDLYKSFASLYLWRIYKKKGDAINEQLYFDEAVSKCPSEELKICIERQRQDAAY